MGAPLFPALFRWLAPSRSAQTPSGPQYVPVPRDGSLTLPEAYYWHYERNPYQPVFIWRGKTELVHLTYSDVIPAAERAARYVAAAAGIELDANITYTKPVVILAASGELLFSLWFLRFVDRDTARHSCLCDHTHWFMACRDTGVPYHATFLVFGGG